MTEIFTHLFGGWQSAHATRWANPDGTVGGIVATSAKLYKTLFVPADATIWQNASIGDGVRIGGCASIGDGAWIGDGASIGDGAWIGYGASIDKDDWWVTAGPIGAHKRSVTAVHSEKHGLRFWVGCQTGISIEVFGERLSESHAPAGAPDLVCYEYANFIGYVLSHPIYLQRINAKERK